MDIKNFIYKNKLSFVPFDYQTGKNQKYKPVIKGYRELTHEQSLEVLKEKGERNGFLININSEFVCFDTDTEKAYFLMVSLLEDLIKTFDYEKNILSFTPSYSRQENDDLYYKNHFYFKLDQENETHKEFLNEMNNKNKLNYLVDGLDVILDKVAEHKKTKINEPVLLPEPLAKGIIKHLKEQKEQRKNKKSFSSGITTPKDKEEIKFLLDCLKPSRSDNYGDWLAVAFILKNSGDNLDLFKYFSSKSPKYNEKQVIKFYENLDIKKDSLTLGALENMAKADNKEKYKEYLKTFSKLKTYEMVKEEFEKKAFKILHPCSYCYILNNKLISLNKTEFFNTFENLNYEKEDKNGKIKKINFTRKWMTDENIKYYDYMDFYPKQNHPENIYNTFQGFKIDNENYDNIEEKDWKGSIIEEHINRITNYNEELKKYFLMWLSNRVKMPYKKPLIALIIKGVQGSGKNSFFEWLGGHIIGNDYFNISEKCDLVYGKFNPNLKHKILIINDEISRENSIKYKEQIKDTITAENVDINEKGIKSYMVRNCAGFVFLTNNFENIKADFKERRFLFFEMNEEKANNKEYFDELYKAFNSKEYNKSFYKYLLSLDCGNFDFTKKPKTEYQELQKLINAPVIIQFFIEKMEKGKFKEEYENKTLLNKYKNYLINMNYDIKGLNLIKLGLLIKKYKIGESKQKKTKGTKKTFYYIDKNEILKYTPDFTN